MRSLTAEQRRALIMLAAAGQNGVSRSLLSAHGLNATMIRGLVSRGLATTRRENVRAGDKLVEIGKVWVTDAGHVALAAEG
jgi:hypothetical protein